MTKLVLDKFLAIFGLLVLLLPMFVLGLLVRLTSPGPAIHWSRRYGLGNQLFYMPKFRTMLVNAPQLATDVIQDPGKWITPVGMLLRKTSLDELPQLWTVLTGKMSLVGPRPALFNQYELIARRESLGITALRPGITGLAQVNGRDEIGDDDKVHFDRLYLERQSLFLDVRILFVTVFKVLRKEGVRCPNAGKWADSPRLA